MGSAGQLARPPRQPSIEPRDEQHALSPRAAWAVLGVSVVSRSLLSTVVALLLWGVLPNLAGFPTTTVMSGSMAPRLMTGDVVVVRPVEAADLAQGQVLLFDDPDHEGRLRLHRLVAIGEDGGLVTRGDANPDADSSGIAMDAVHGAGFLRVPFAGLPAYWVRTRQVAPLVGGAVLLALLVAGVRLGRLLEDADEPRRGSHRGVRLPALHRAAAAGAALIVLGAAAVVPAPEARAAFNATTRSSAASWRSHCGDVAPSPGAPRPLFLWGYGSVSGQEVASSTGTAGAGVLSGDAVRSTCSGGFSPTISVGAAAGASVPGVIAERTIRAFPSSVTVATWFRTRSPGGVLADFGGSANAVPSALNAIDRVLYMQADGNLTFGSSTLSLLNLQLGKITCTTTAPGGYANGGWHLVVATYSDAAGCSIAVDAAAPVTLGPALTLQALTGYPGYWRFGYDAVTPGAWPLATVRQHFVGDLDESQAYDSVLTPEQRTAILTRGH